MSEQANPIGGGKQHAFPPAAWPQVTFDAGIALHFNGDDIDVTHIPNAHTDGDAIIRFRKANVLFAADLFNSGDYTRIDPRGGSLDGMIAAYRTLLPTLNESTKVVPGRGRVAGKRDLEEYLKVMVALRDRIGEQIQRRYDHGTDRCIETDRRVRRALGEWTRAPRSICRRNI